MTNPIIETAAAILAPLRDEVRIELLRHAAAETPARSVKGEANGRFYSRQIGIGVRAIRAMEDEGHGEKIYTGKGANSGVKFFPVEILERMVEARA